MATLPQGATGPAHVGVVSFLAARAAPTGGFWIALAGGVALARVAERRGARLGFGASAAAMLETVAIIGPARFGVPLTQAVSAPMLGRLHARGVGFWPQLLACSLVRVLHNAATTAFFIWVITGGLDAYAGTYDALGRRLGLEVGTGDALALTLAGLLAWAAFASTVQVLVYRRGLRAWEGGEARERRPELPGVEEGEDAPPPELLREVEAEDAPPRERLREVEGGARARARRFDPRVIALAAVVGFVLLLASTEWVLLAAVAAWLAVAWAVSRPELAPLRPGLLFAAVLAAGAFAFALGGGLGLELALRRACRAALLVLVATWLRAAAGAPGLREVSRRALGRLRRVPSATEAAAVLDAIASEVRLTAAGRSLAAQISSSQKHPRALVDAVLGWVMREAGAFRPVVAARPLSLSARVSDWALLASAALPALAFYA
jgi:hypothetical protein